MTGSGLSIDGICIGISNRICCRTYRAGGIGIALFAEDVAGIIVGPYPAPPRGLVILPNQLIGTIVGVLKKERLED